MPGTSYEAGYPDAEDEWGPGGYGASVQFPDDGWVAPRHPARGGYAPGTAGPLDDARPLPFAAEGVLAEGKHRLPSGSPTLYRHNIWVRPVAEGATGIPRHRDGVSRDAAMKAKLRTWEIVGWGIVLAFAIGLMAVAALA